MDYTEVRVMLKSYLHKKRLLLTIKTVIEQSKDDLYDLQAIDYSKDRVKSSPCSDNCVCDLVIRANERVNKLEIKYEKISKELFDIEDKIAKFLPLLSDEEQNLIIDRYMENISIPKLSRKYYYDYNSMKNKFTKIYKKISSDY